MYFEDLPVKVELFLRNETKLKTVSTLTHIHYIRPCKSITSTLKIKNINRLLESIKKIKALKSNISFKDRFYINIRLILSIHIINWFLFKCLINKINTKKY